MLSGNYISIKLIIDKLFEEEAYDQEPKWDSILEWTWDAMNKIGARTAYIEEFETLVVENHRVELPCNFFKLLPAGIKDCETGIPLIPSTGTYHNDVSCSCDANPCSCSNVYTYKLNDHYIFTGFEEGSIRVAYLAFPIDDNGFPKVPDEERYISAIVAYLRYKIDHILFRQNRINREVYEEAKQEWYFYVNSARNKAKLPDVNKMESLKNQWVRLIPRINMHNGSFKGLNDSEQRYTHNSI